MNSRMVGSVSFWRDGILESKKHNLVVNSAKLSIIEAISGSSGGHIASFGVGDILDPTDPDKSDTDLQSPSYISKSFQPVDVHNSGNSITFSLNLISSEGNDSTNGFSELGLFAENGTLFARVLTGEAILKDSTSALRWDWEIGYN